MRLLVIEFGGNSGHSLYGIAQLGRGVYPPAHFLIEIIKSPTSSVACSNGVPQGSTSARPIYVRLLQPGLGHIYK